MNTLTELVFILDRSGSMAGLEEDTIGGFNSLIAKQKTEDGEAIVSTVLFSDTRDILHDRLSINKVTPMTNREYYVRGCTALLDAVGNAIHHIGNIYKHTPKNKRPGRTLFIITTDGMENSSRRYTYEKVKSMIEYQKSKYDWEFLFLGANIDATAEAECLGINSDFAATYVADAAGTQAMHASQRNATIAMRAGHCAPGGAWKQEIDQDMNRRKKSILDPSEIVSKKKRWPFKKN